MNLENFTLGPVDLKKVATHLLVYFVGFGALGAIQYLTKFDFGAYSVVAGLVLGTLADIIRKVLDGYKE